MHRAPKVMTMISILIKMEMQTVMCKVIMQIPNSNCNGDNGNMYGDCNNIEDDESDVNNNNSITDNKK